MCVCVCIVRCILRVQRISTTIQVGFHHHGFLVIHRWRTTTIKAILVGGEPCFIFLKVPPTCSVVDHSVLCLSVCLSWSSDFAACLTCIIFIVLVVCRILDGIRHDLWPLNGGLISSSGYLSNVQPVLSGQFPPSGHYSMPSRSSVVTWPINSLVFFFALRLFCFILVAISRFILRFAGY